MDSPHEILDVAPDADDEAIERAYRRKVMETHPDQGGSTEAFQLVRAAYDAIEAGETGEFDETAVDTDPENVDRKPASAETTVEYLNYDAIEDYEWTLDDDDLFEKADTTDLDPLDHGEFVVEPGESLLEAAERRGYAWPYACRGGACANCAVALVDGELSQPTDHILDDDLLDRDFRLSCNGVPLSGELKVVYNVKHLPGLDELRLPPYPFELAHADD
ncbi:ferredoxin Fer [Halobacterium litoreum]|uniref:Ferredoxin Fer n=1 Tax=Halobacterium litoreum TaxID=2039234 RepID=A0ABD5NEK0_9EURY|nr:ferredoxin Fer [Halobacterium litoreum]UHH13548.1 2Fe-2S iron-sulfur cluster-binding protein [Halobacterium litoreum]